MPRPSRSLPALDHTPHLAFAYESLWPGNEIVIDGHKFIIERFEPLTYLSVHQPHPGGEDTFDSVASVDLKLTHAPWRGCPATEAPLNVDEIRFDEYASGHDRTMRLTHLPTGLVVSAGVETSTLQTREKLLTELTARIAEHGGAADA